MKQDIYWEITHKNHVLYIPTSIEKLEHLTDIIPLRKDSDVLDVACGKGTFLFILNNHSPINGIGLDRSKSNIADANFRLRKSNKASCLQFLHSDSEMIDIRSQGQFDLAVCLGPTESFRGYQNTLKMLSGYTRKNGLIVIGEYFWKQKPSSEYLEAKGLKVNCLNEYFEGVIVGEAMQLTFLYSIVSSTEDLDRYEGLQWLAAQNYASANSDDAYVPDVIRQAKTRRNEYLKWGRQFLGWSIYVFKNFM